MSNATRQAELAETYGTWIPLREARRICLDRIQPQSRREYRDFVTECIFGEFNELEKSVFASRQYILTLWPAFIGFISSLAPDPYVMVYDNFWWAVLFGLTCSGLPGLSNDTPAHHIEVLTDKEGKEKCESWKHDRDKPREMSRSYADKKFYKSKVRAFTEWTAFFFSMALYLVFVALFGWTLQDAVTLSFPVDQWLSPAVWYYISISPAVWGALVELVNNRVDLYEPESGRTRSDDLELTDTGSDASSMTGQLLPAPKTYSETVYATGGHMSSADASHPARYKHQKGSSVQTFARIIKLQWQRGPYRVLIKARPDKGFLGVFNNVNVGLIAIGRVTVWALGSVAMGNVLLMPVPNDLALFVLLLFTTAVPRFMWPTVWKKGVRGADMVVWVKPV